MNEELQTKLVGLLDRMTDTVNKAVDFSIYQVSDIISQYIIFYGVIYTVGALASGFAGFKLYQFMKREYSTYHALTPNKKYDAEMGYVFKIIFSVIGQFAMISTSVYCAYWATMVWVAPKIFLITKLAELYKSVK